MTIFDKKLNQEERYDIVCKLDTSIYELIKIEQFYVLGYEEGDPYTLLIGNNPTLVFECPHCHEKKYIIHSKHIRSTIIQNEPFSLRINALLHKFKCKSCSKIFTEPIWLFEKYNRYDVITKNRVIDLYMSEGASYQKLSNEMDIFHGTKLSKSSIGNILKEDKESYVNYKKEHDAFSEIDKELDYVIDDYF